MADKRARKPRNDSATGLRLAMIEAATAYPEWPTELVELPSRQRDRGRALGWYAAPAEASHAERVAAGRRGARRAAEPDAGRLGA